MSETVMMEAGRAEVEVLVDLLRRAQEFIGSETSDEARSPRYESAVYVPPESDGDRLRREAARADRRDQLIREMRSWLKRYPL